MFDRITICSRLVTSQNEDTIPNLSSHLIIIVFAVQSGNSFAKDINQVRDNAHTMGGQTNSRIRPSRADECHEYPKYLLLPQYEATWETFLRAFINNI